MADVSIEAFFASCPEMLFVANAEGRITQRSAALSRRFGAAELTLTALAHAGALSGLAGFLDALVAGGQPAEHTFQASDGAALRCHAQRATDGALHGALHPVAAAETTPNSSGDGRPAASEGGMTARIERRLLRALMDNLDMVLWAIDRDGRFVYHDGKGLAAAGMKPGQLLGLNIFELYDGGGDEIRSAFTGAASTNSEQQHGVHWDNWYVPAKNERGDVDYVVGISLDVTAAKQAEEALKRQLETVSQQQRAIQELSTPLIEVWDKVLTAPLVGVIDSQRASSLIERLLDEVSRAGARFAILDLTGVEALDTSTASHLIQLLASIRLLGAEGVITGISPYVAQTMVSIGIDMSAVRTCANLRDGLRYCMAKLA